MLEADADTIVASDTMHKVVVYRLYSFRIVTKCMVRYTYFSSITPLTRVVTHCDMFYVG
jgi:hypothetical protein